MQNNDNDQTARRYQGEFRGKKILIVGSGYDLDGRGLGERIDSGEWDVVARINKHYGKPEDVGNRTDVILTRWYSWLDNYDWFSEEEQKNAQQVVILNQHVGYAHTEYDWLCHLVGHQSVSAGAQAIDFFLHRGAARVDVIGYGCLDGKFRHDKVYTRQSCGGMSGVGQDRVDHNQHYDWHKERLWEVNQARVRFL